ncbi:hypothetical protein ACB376_28470, partial [Klebsiella electrica]
MPQRYNTGNSRPSNSMKDLNDNALAFDDYMNTESDIYIDRFGNAKDSLSGTAIKITAAAGVAVEATRQNLIPLSRQYMTLAAAQADIANIPDGSATYVRSADGSSLADEYINNGGTLEATGRKMPSQGYIDGIIRKDDINSPAASIATKDGFSVCSFYVNEETGNIEMIVDKIPQVNADTVDFNGVTLARSESGM